MSIADNQETFLLKDMLCIFFQLFGDGASQYTGLPICLSIRGDEDKKLKSLALKSSQAAPILPFLPLIPKT